MNPPYPISDAFQGALTYVWQRYSSPIAAQQQPVAIENAHSRISNPDDNTVILRIEKSEKCAPLWNSLASGNGETIQGSDKSGSAIDMKLVRLISCFTDNPVQIERIWLSTQHGQRDKTRNRPDYRAATIQKALTEYLPKIDFSTETTPTNIGEATPHQPQAEKKGNFAATPFSLKEAQGVAMRDFIYDKFYLREIVSITAAPGGVGKSSLVLTEALAMASYRNLLGVEVIFQSRVWYWNGEDTRAELMRRFVGAAKYYGLKQSDFDNFLFVDSGHDVQIVVATTTRDGTVINAPIIENLVRVIRANKLDVLIIDPFISSHNVSETDNPAIDKVIKLYSRIAAKEGISIMLVHHSRKLNGNQGTGDDIRGGSAIRDAVRSARILHPMSESEAKKHSIEDHSAYFYATDDKQNFAKRSNSRQFYRMETTRLDNGIFRNNDGDFVGVVNRWHPTYKAAELTDEQKQKLLEKLGSRPARYSAQSPAWIGYQIAEALGMNIEEAGSKKYIKYLIEQWKISGAMECYDEIVGGQERPMIRIIDFEKLTPPPEN